jgi:hypothetical protein
MRERVGERRNPDQCYRYGCEFPTKGRSTSACKCGQSLHVLRLPEWAAVKQIVARCCCAAVGRLAILRKRRSGSSKDILTLRRQELSAQ